MREFGQYRIDALMGAGGMGEVYRAYDTRRDREVALKLLPEIVREDPEYQKRFRRESYAVARLREPHVIPIHDYGEIDERLYIDMRLVDGRNLGVVIAEDGPMSPERAVALISQVAEALDAAHGDGLVHRDVKPTNILVTPSDFVYVVDFGIAYAVGHTRSRLTLTGATLGTIAYMAPERFENRPVDVRTDVYSLACVLHECLTGSAPFTRADLPSMMYAHLYLDPPPAATVNQAVPAALDEVIRRGMAKDPSRRFGRAGELAAAARSALAGSGTDAERTVDARFGVAEGEESTVAVDRHSVPVALVEIPAPRDVERTEHLTHPTIAVGAGVLAGVAAGVTGGIAAGGGPAGGRAGGGGGPDRTPERGDSAPPPVDPPTQPPTAVPQPSSRRRWIALVVGVVLTAALVAAITITAVRLTAPTPTVGSAPIAGGADPGQAPPITPSTAGAKPYVGNASPQPTVNTTVPVGPTPGYMELSPDGKIGYIANRGAGVVTLYDTVRNVVVGTIPIPEGGPQFVAFAPDGRRAYVSVFNNERTVNVVDVIDTETKAVVATVPVGIRPFALRVTPDGRKVYVPNHDSGSITVIDTASNAVVNTIHVDPNPHWVDISRDGKRLYAANHESNVITIIDLPSEKVLSTIPVGKSPHSILVHPTLPLVFNVNYDGNTVSVTDINTGANVATVPTGNHPQDITLSGDGKYAYLVDVDDNAVQVLDTKTFEIRSSVGVGQSPTSIAVAPDGRHGYVTNLADGTVTVLNLASTA